jgi:hypothetical protein
MSDDQQQSKRSEAQEWQMLAGQDLDIEELEQRLEMALLMPFDNCGADGSCVSHDCVSNICQVDGCFTDGCNAHCC